MQELLVTATGNMYRYVMKPILFQFDPEKVHQYMTSFGERIGKSNNATRLTKKLFHIHDKRLSQNIADITFSSPIGLAAGFDYEAKLTQILPALGFGFHTIGTITNSSYGGNPRPLLGRLPKSKSLMVNKGFKNLGASVTAKKLSKLLFDIPVGISIGRTNSANLDQKQSVKDIIAAFIIFENSNVKHSYYELNISCPNLFGNVTFYTPENLRELLRGIDALHLKRPVFIKMPIEKSNEETVKIMETAAHFSPKGVIFGNLQKDRKHPALDKNEVKKFSKGNFSGKPTYARSNELISLAYKHYKKRYVIIGCGGVFTADDAIEKISRGASLIQMITGMIYQGPQVISEINSGLIAYMQKNGVKHISELVGTKRML